MKALLFIMLVFLINCWSSKYQQSPLKSPDGQLIYSIKKESHQNGNLEESSWRSSLHTKDDILLYKDAIGISGDEKIYWMWDKNKPRVWILSVTNGQFYILEQTELGYDNPNIDYKVFWQKVSYPELCSQKQICPPDELNKLIK